jgi:pantoate--beta-alanine ligase
MIVADSVAALREQVALWRIQGQRVGLVPTMGNLHQGHLQLVERAREVSDRVVVSIFVNPLQFGEGEDFESYPHTPAEDTEKLREAGADLLFSPPVSEVYPRSQAEQAKVEVPHLSDILCGASRPGHFIGVATVVCKLFNMVQPDVAVFGDKDFQQLTVIRRMTEDLCLPVEILGVPTVREEEGVARSSRNAYLTAEERSRAPVLYRALRETAERIRGGRRDYHSLEEEAAHALEDAGFRPDYFTVRRADDLEVPEEGERELVILAAAYLGRARLIDNLQFSLS